MTRIIDSTTIYDGTAKVLNVSGGEQVKIQELMAHGLMNLDQNIVLTVITVAKNSFY